MTVCTHLSANASHVNASRRLVKNIYIQLAVQTSIEEGFEEYSRTDLIALQ